MSILKNMSPFLAAGLSGVFLVLSFPPFEVEFLGWVALVPLVMACSKASARRAAVLGWIAGIVFFIGSLYWLRNVSWAGYLALSSYCAIFFIPFAVFIALRPGGWSGMSRLKNMGWMVAAAAVWAAAEYVRATLFTGFPWNLLGISQYAQTSLIQITAWGGVYMLSALMVLVSMGVGITLLQYISGNRNSGYKIHVELMVALFIVAAAASYGLGILLSEETTGEPIHVALIQPNVPEVGNWELADPELIYSRLTDLTDLATRTPNLDLLIWPETALPDFVRYSSRSSALVKRFCKTVPMLVGSMDVEHLEGGEQRYFNGSLLFDTQGTLLKTYHKQHLVLFGEYIPFDGRIAWIDALTPVDSSFASGKETTLFSLPDGSGAFCVLICFEDTLPYLARRAAKAGATWLVNQTNDSWFDPDSESVQHFSHAIFRAVENRLPLVRCTNTGVTCDIDTKGRAHQTLEPRVEGFHTAIVNPVDPNRKLTFYTRYGDLFAQACLLGSIALFISLIFKTRKKKHA